MISLQAIHIFYPSLSAFVLRIVTLFAVIFIPDTSKKKGGAKFSDSSSGCHNYFEVHFRTVLHQSNILRYTRTSER